MDYKFQINLGGIIDLLSNHLYSGPEVFVRELLQNAVDAIVARRHVEPEHAGAIEIEVPTPAPGAPPRVVFTDNGIGLDEEEIHRFLATIGQTSKRDELDERRSDFIGQFGIGLLSCFVVSDEIVVVTRSARGDAPTMEWRGRADGTYTIRVLAETAPAGTRVELTCKPGREEFFEPGRVAELARHYGSLLPFPINLSADGRRVHVNEDEPPWRRAFTNPQQERAAYMRYGERAFGVEFFDHIPLRAAAGDVQGVAFVLPFAPSLAARKTHRVYLKNMLLSEQAEGLLPDWAFFVKCVVNANDLRPTASRESFYEDDALRATRTALGQALRDYLIELARHEPSRLQRLILLHYLSIKALAVDDDEFYRLFIAWLPFETNMGRMTLSEYRKQHEVVRFVPDLDQFRQIARVAAAQNLCVINGAYTYDRELLEKLEDVFPGARTEWVDATSLTYSFDYLTLDEQDEVADFVRFADEVLRPFSCAAEVRRFQPHELPALYTASTELNFRRSVEQTKEIADGLWSSVLTNVAGELPAEAFATLCFNYNSPLVYKLSRVQDETLVRLAVQTLYVQSLLLSHRPLNAAEMKLLNEGLLGLLEWGVDAGGGWLH
ncbi:MAG TPA: HSP90 family protein [Pyrinomonadaceae bacterium]|jgi:molecular chaperone HtpG